MGVLREHEEKDREARAIRRCLHPANDDVLLPVAAATAFVLRVPEWAEEGFDSVVVTVDREEAVKDVAQQVEKMGFTEFSLAEFIDMVRMNVLLVSIATAFVAIVALVVAAIGITNTMIMSVLERTHEIGIMKALGARDGHIRLIFVVEGVLDGPARQRARPAAGLAGLVPGRLDRPEHHGAANADAGQGVALRLPALAGRGRAGPGLPDHHARGVVSGLAGARVDPVTSLRHE